MKRAFISLFLFIALASAAVGQNANDWFITVWEPSGTTIYFNATGNGYTLKCVQLNSVGNEIPATMQTFTGVNGSYTITTGITAGQKYRIYAYGGTFNKVGFFYSKTLLKVEQWGTTQWATMNRAFYKCENMDVTAPDKPNLSAVTDMSEMFYECYKLVNANGSMKNWNTANVTDMNSMFFGSFLFNQDISGWNVSNVTNMKAMFAYAKIFNQDISRWNVSKVTNMRAMFSNTEAFNQDISGWDVSHVTYMNSMFYETKVFNQNINSWDVSSVTDISYMFYKAKHSISHSITGMYRTWKI